MPFCCFHFHFFLLNSTAMAQFSLLFGFFCFVVVFSMSGFVVVSQPALGFAEQEAVYRVLEAVSPGTQWRSLFPDDLCVSAPHGIVCEYFSDDSSGDGGGGDVVTAHITEMNFGYVSDYSPNPSCFPNSTLNPSLFSPLSHLRKLFFFKCFMEKKVQFPDISSVLYNSSLEELVFIENPSLQGPINGSIRNLTALRRLVLAGTNVSGEISNGFDGLNNLEQLTLSRNKFQGEIPSHVFQNMKKLTILDLSANGFQGNVPESIGNLSELLKIDLSLNGFSGKIPENLKGLKQLEFLDLSYNHFTNSGVPLFLAEMPRLKEVYLSGNFLGGHIPEIWQNLVGVQRIGLSNTGLAGNIPTSMGLHLGNLCYLGLDNNKLEGTVPKEFEALKSVNELNLQNNNLTGRVPFSATFVSKLGEKLKLEGNPDLCVDDGLRSAKLSSTLGQLKLCSKPAIPHTALPIAGSHLTLPHAFNLFSSIGFALVFLR